MHLLRALPVILIGLIITTLPIQAAEDTDWTKINTIGLFNTAEDGQISDELWDGYTQDKALQTLRHFPNTLRSPAYKSVMRKLLLSSESPLDGDIDSPLFLAKRIEMLIQYGLFEDAQNLYDMTGSLAKDDFDLALMGVALTMTRDALPSACLDIKTLNNKFQNMPAWRELSHYCTARFGEKNTLSASDLEFKHYPLLDQLLVGDLNAIPNGLSVIETLMAFSDKRISPSLYNRLAKTPEMANDLFIKLALNPTQLDKPTYQCFVIESALRGISNHDKLTQLYESAVFKDGMMDGETQSVNIHPCEVPAFFYQRLLKTQTPDMEIPVLLDSIQGISMHAFAPHASYIEQSYDLNAKHGWTAALILALNDKQIDETILNAPIRSILKNESLSNKEAVEWKNTFEKTDLNIVSQTDLALPIYISRINSGDFSKLDRNSDKFNYENFFSLTYTKKSLHSGIGINDALSKAIAKNDIPRTALIALSGLGKFKPSDIQPNAIAVILSSFGEYKLDKEKQMLAIEALH